MKDLFNHWKQLPKEVINLIDKYNNKTDNDYIDFLQFRNDLEDVGYTCEVGLDNIPYNLRKINS